MACAALIFPPQWCPTHPYLALPSLKAYLQARGHVVIQRDLNIEFYRQILNQDYLVERLSVVTERFSLLEGTNELSPSQQDQYRSHFQAISTSTYLLRHLDDALMVLADDRFYDIGKLEHSLWVLNLALQLVSSSYYPTQISLTSFTTGYSPYSSQDIIKVAQDEAQNPLLPLLPNLLKDWVETNEPELIGISITGDSQIIPGFTIGRWIKRSFPAIHVVFGGSVISRWHDILPNLNRLFEECLDSAILFEGEVPLHKLLMSIQKGTGMDKIPNLVYKTPAGHITRTDLSLLSLKAGDLPTPDFEGLPLHAYLSPVTVLPILSSRGCYWNRCTFCDHSYVYGNRYSSRRAHQVATDIEKLSVTHQVHHFAFSDECISPHGLRKLTAALIERNVKISWVAASRFEKKLAEQDFCEKLSDAGLKALYLGLESASNSILLDMDKGTEIETINKICTELSQASIWTHLFTMFGFPTESDTEAAETVSFIENNLDVVHSAGASYFGLSKYSEIFNNPNRYNIQILPPPAGQDMTLYYPFERENRWMTEKTLEIYNEFKQKNIIDMPLARISHLLERGHLLLYLSKYSIEELRNICRILPEKEVDQAFQIRDETTFVVSPLVYEADLNFNFLFDQKRLTSVTTPQHCSILFHIKSGRLLNLSRLAKEILELCRKNSTFVQIIDTLSQRYADHQQMTIYATVSNFLYTLHRYGFVLGLNQPAAYRNEEIRHGF
jgi:anaerobic magnesium-protoporphyrin IX monomethyl ester cyclase